MSTATNAGTTAADPLQTIAADRLFAQGEALAHSGDALRAEQYLSAAVQRGFPAQRALPLLLRVCIASSRLSAALQYAAPYLQDHPEDSRLRYLVAAVQLGLHRPAEASLELSRVLRQAPQAADAHYMLGVIERDYDHDRDAAAEHFRKYAELAPRGVHSAELAAWLREYALLSPAAPAADSGEGGLAAPAAAAEVAP